MARLQLHKTEVDAAEGASQCTPGFEVLDPDRASVHPTLDALDHLQRREGEVHYRGSSCSEQSLESGEEAERHGVQQKAHCWGGSGNARAC